MFSKPKASKPQPPPLPPCGPLEMGEAVLRSFSPEFLQTIERSPNTEQKSDLQRLPRDEACRLVAQLQLDERSARATASALVKATRILSRGGQDLEQAAVQLTASVFAFADASGDLAGLFRRAAEGTSEGGMLAEHTDRFSAYVNGARQLHSDLTRFKAQLELVRT